MFGRPYRVTLGKVQCTVIFKECSEELKLKVSADPDALILAVKRCQPRLNKLKNEMTETNAAELKTQIRADAFLFSMALFGEEQTKKLFEFYANNHLSVLQACTQFFTNDLSKLIVKVQKRRRHETVR